MYATYLTSREQTEQRFLREDLQHLLIMRPDTASDVIMLSPALRALKQTLPQAEITLLTSSRGSQIVPLLPWVDQVMVYPESWREITESTLLNLRKDMMFIEQLREQRVSMALIFTGPSESPWPSAYACYLAGIPHRIGFAEDMNGSALSHFLPPPAEDAHQVDRNLNLLEVLGIYEANRQIELSISAGVEKRVSELLSESGVRQGMPYILLAPEASLAAHRYDPHHFAAAARILSAQTELQLVVVGGSEQIEIIQPVLQVAHENLYGNVHSLVGKTALLELAAVMRGASLTITNRSATMLLAEALHAPLLVLSPNTDTSNTWHPRGTSARVLSRPESCSLCYESECRYGVKCLDVRPEEVAIAALEMLGEQTYSPVTYHVLQEYQSELSSI